MPSPLCRRTLLKLPLAAACALPAAARAQAYPSRPVRIVVAAVAGSAQDLSVRRMTGMLAELLRQPIVADNRPGANGIIAAGEVARAPADGHTLLSGHVGNVINDLLRPQFGARMVDDLAPVTDLTAGPLLLLAHPSLPVRTVKDLVDYAKLHPGDMNYGSGGPGSLPQLTAERIKHAAAIDLTEVPYRASGAGMLDLLAGHVQLGFAMWSVAAQHVRGGALKALAVVADRRLPPAPDIPTLAEAGIADITATGWNGLFAPAGTPPDVIASLSRAVAISLAQPGYQRLFMQEGHEVGGKSPEQFAAFIRTEKARYAQIIQAAHIRLM